MDFGKLPQDLGFELTIGGIYVNPDLIGPRVATINPTQCLEDSRFSIVRRNDNRNTRSRTRRLSGEGGLASKPLLDLRKKLLAFGGCGRMQFAKRADAQILHAQKNTLSEQRVCRSLIVKLEPPLGSLEEPMKNQKLALIKGCHVCQHQKLA